MTLYKKFWKWYEDNYTLNAGIAAGLFLIQIIHLIWLFGEVVWFKATGTPLFTLEGIWKPIIIFVDYTEIPAILSVSLVYINEIRKSHNVKSWLYLFFINSQWLHLFWITDEFVIQSLVTTEQTMLPLWLAWVAILIDYLELPVIVETMKKFVQSLKEDRAKEFLAKDLKEI
ncbi:MAG: hypothetical protein WDZ70_01545 [Candidatus Paceibacterota bacterium]